MTAITTWVIAGIVVAVVTLGMLLRKHPDDSRNTANEKQTKSAKVRWRLYLTLAAIAILGLVLVSTYLGWVTMPDISISNAKKALFVVLTAFAALVLLTTSWGRNLLLGISFAAGSIGLIAVLVLFLLWPDELRDMWHSQDNDVPKVLPEGKTSATDGKVVHLPSEIRYYTVFGPHELRRFKLIKDHCPFMHTPTERGVWYDSWVPAGSDILYVSNRHNREVPVTIRNTPEGTSWQGELCQ